MPDDERAAVAELCDQLPRLRSEISRHPPGVQQLLADIVTRAMAGEPVHALLGRLYAGGQTGRIRGLEPLPGLGPGRSNEERFACPAGLCDREARTEPAGPLPRCWLTSRYMKLLTDG